MAKLYLFIGVLIAIGGVVANVDDGDVVDTEDIK